jgi:hypothetical protein
MMKGSVSLKICNRENSVTRSYEIVYSSHLIEFTLFLAESLSFAMIMGGSASGFFEASGVDPNMLVAGGGFLGLGRWG